VVVVALVAVMGVVYALQRSLVFPAPRVGEVPSAPAGVVRVPGGTLMAYVPPPTSTAPVVVHFHGNAEQVSRTVWLGAALQARGVGFAAVEYPGYGLVADEGSPSEDSLVDAGEKALAHLVSMGVSRDRLVLSGQSVGTGVAVTLAARGWGTHLLLVSPYTSLPDVGARDLPFLPVRLLMRDRFDSLGRAPDVTIPVLVVHGTNDEVIPYDLGERLAGAFPSARFVSVVGGTHNTMWQRREVMDAALGFLVGDGT